MDGLILNRKPDCGLDRGLAVHSLAMERLSEPSDAELLRQWTDHRSPEAFASLARRYAGLVHAVATRNVNGDRATADDVTQAVFVLLANKAGQLSGRRTLAGWLHRTTCYAAANARRVNARRRKHEHAAAHQRPEATMTGRPDDAVHEQIDAAIHQLGDGDRQLIVDRYFMGQDEAGMAAALGVSRSTVQKRLSRAVGRLRRMLGHSVVTAALPVLLAQSAAPQASAALVERLTQTALGGPAGEAVGPIVGMTGRRLAMEKLLHVGKWALLPAAGVGLTIAVVMATNSPAGPPATRPAMAAIGPTAEVRPMTTQADADALAKQILGRWRMKAGWKGNRPMPEAQNANTTITITPDRFEVSGPGIKTEGATYVLVPGGPWVMLDIRDDNRPERSMPGIVSLQNGRLRLAFDDKQFLTPEGFMPEVISPKAMELERIEP